MNLTVELGYTIFIFFFMLLAMGFEIWGIFLSRKVRRLENELKNYRTGGISCPQTELDQQQ